MDYIQPHTYFSTSLADIDHENYVKVRADFHSHHQTLILEVNGVELPKRAIKELRDLLNTLPLGE